MTQIDILLLFGTLAFAAVGICVVLLFVKRGTVEPESSISKIGMIGLTCSVCRQRLAFTRKELYILSNAEMALAVSARPRVRGKMLAEYVCPGCGAAHCFMLEGRKALHIGTNLYQPQDVGSLCVNCSKPLKNPPWKPGLYDGVPEYESEPIIIMNDGTEREMSGQSSKKVFKGNPLGKCPELQPDYGLVCDRCGGTCCVECCQYVTKNRLEDGGLLCPRCVRGPLYKFFHFQQ